MVTPSPPKPWERAGSAATSGTSTPVTSTAMTATAPTSTNPSTSSTSSTSAPSLPERPATLNSVVNQTASNYTNQNRFGTGMATGIGTSPYSSPYSSYSSPYNRFGGGMYGGGMYGGGMGYGGGMYGSGMYGGGYGSYPGMPGDPNNPQSLTQTWNQSTAATFQIMEGIVGAFGGFAQMLESAYMTTHSSFFAMVSMAEQLGNLRQTLGSVLGIYTLLRWMRTLLAKLTGRPPPADATALTPANFSSFLSGGRGAAPTTLPDGSPAPPRPSKKPFIFFALAVFGLPYLMGKVIRAMAKSQEEEQRRQQEQMALSYPTTTGPGGEQVPIDPRKLDFCRVLYDYTPAPNSAGMDLEVKKGDFVAVLSKTDPMGNPSEWWRCRARDGKQGYLPSPYLEPIQRPSQRTQQQQQITQGSAVSAPGSRTATMKGGDAVSDAQKLLQDAAADRTKSLSSIYTNNNTNAAKGPQVTGGPGDITAESFQKSAFYS